MWRESRNSLNSALVSLAIMFFYPLIAMVAADNVHDAIPQIPAIGYWTAFWLRFLVVAIITPATQMVKVVED